MNFQTDFTCSHGSENNIFEGNYKGLTLFFPIEYFRKKSCLFCQE